MEQQHESGDEQLQVFREARDHCRLRKGSISVTDRGERDEVEGAMQRSTNGQRHPQETRRTSKSDTYRWTRQARSWATRHNFNAIRDLPCRTCLCMVHLQKRRFETTLAVFIPLTKWPDNHKLEHEHHSAHPRCPCQRRPSGKRTQLCQAEGFEEKARGEGQEQHHDWSKPVYRRTGQSLDLQQHDESEATILAEGIHHRGPVTPKEKVRVLLCVIPDVLARVTRRKENSDRHVADGGKNVHHERVHKWSREPLASADEDEDAQNSAGDSAQFQTIENGSENHFEVIRRGREDETRGEHAGARHNDTKDDRRSDVWRKMTCKLVREHKRCGGGGNGPVEICKTVEFVIDLRVAHIYEDH
mmetsp:Transcript_25904/g.67928  ORF Transcript_25904/g.67928 Transcript_25904/m.67928 type:complete len:359 (-) Transcript_25904:892-1968(-)